MLSITVNTISATRYLNGLPRRIDRALPGLWRQLATPLKQDVRTRLSSADGGRWAKPSKWIKAKKNSRKVLNGLGSRIRSRYTQRALSIYFDSPGEWTLTQHHDGFTKLPELRNVTIPIKNPRPLGLSRGTKWFRFYHGKPSVTPARKVWPTEVEAEVIVAPIASRWIVQVLGK
jgi:hypothetical protein